MQRNYASDLAVAIVVIEFFAILLSGGLILLVIPWYIWLAVPVVVFILASLLGEENAGGKYHP